jgi:hypothetical protein
MKLLDTGRRCMLLVVIALAVGCRSNTPIIGPGSSRACVAKDGAPLRWSLVLASSGGVAGGVTHMTVDDRGHFVSEHGRSSIEPFVVPPEVLAQIAKLVEGICREGQLRQLVSSTDSAGSNQRAPFPDYSSNDFRLTYDRVTFELRSDTPEYNAMYTLLVAQ